MYRVTIDSMPVDYSGLIISIISLVIAVVSLIVALRTLRIQKKHNVNSVRPIIDILVGDYENNIYVKLKNVGIGPASIDELICSYKGNMTSKEIKVTSLIALLTTPGLTSSTIEMYSTYVEDVVGRTIPSNGEIVLVKLTNGGEMKNMALRLVLKDVSVHIKYRDIYDTSFSNCRKLVFFGRNISL